MTSKAKNLILEGKTQAGTPVMSTFLEQIGIRVDALEEKVNLLKSIDKTNRTEFLMVYRGFFPKDQISKCLSTTKLPWSPMNDVVSVESYEPTYETTLEIRVDLHEPWSDVAVNKSFKNPYGMFKKPENDEEVEQINHGLIWVDLQYGETNSTGFFLMTGAGLLALAETNPDLYRGLTSKTDGNLHWEGMPGELLHPITAEIELPRYEQFYDEPEIKKLTNYYYWNYTSNEDGLEFIPHKIPNKIDREINTDHWDEIRWRQRTESCTTSNLFDYDNVYHDTPFEIMLGKVTADYLL